MAEGDRTSDILAGQPQNAEPVAVHSLLMPTFYFNGTNISML